MRKALCCLLLCLLATFALGSVANPLASTSATINTVDHVSVPAVAHVPVPLPPIVAHVPGLPTPTCGGPLPPCPGGSVTNSTMELDIATVGQKPPCNPCQLCPGQPGTPCFTGTSSIAAALPQPQCPPNNFVCPVKPPVDMAAAFPQSCIPGKTCAPGAHLPLPLPPRATLDDLSFAKPPVGADCTQRTLPNGCREIICGSNRIVTCG